MGSASGEPKTASAGVEQPGRGRSSLHWVSSELWRGRARGGLRGAAGSEEEDAREDSEEGKGLYVQLPLNMSLQTKMDNMELRSIDAMAANFHTFILEQVRTLKLCKTGKTNILIIRPLPMAPSLTPSPMSPAHPLHPRDWSSFVVRKPRHRDVLQPQTVLHREKAKVALGWYVPLGDSGDKEMSSPHASLTAGSLTRHI